ncbi:MAG: tetratricopeptide repeat protein [Bacteroidia bacterium]|nr:tetratricopeptide repeat protein [Bacteroidia bacterium]
MLGKYGWGLRLVWGAVLALAIGSCSKDAAEQTETAEDVNVFLSDSAAADPAARLQSLNRQLEMNPGDYTLYQQRAVTYYELDSLQKAINDIETGISLFRNSPDLHYWRGFFAFTVNDTAKAMAEYQAAAGLGSKSPETFYQMGQIYFFQGNDQLAFEMYDKAIALNDSDPLYIFAKGFLEERRRKHSAAIKFYLRSLELDPGFDKALIRLHDLYLEHYENETEAVKYLDELLAVNPGHSLARFYKGNYYFRRAMNVYNESQMELFRTRINESVAEYTISINRDPAYAQAWYNRGYCYFLADRHQEAMKDFEECLKNNPAHVSAAFMLGSIYEYFKDYKTALYYYQISLKNKPDYADAQKAVKEMQEKMK